MTIGASFPALRGGWLSRLMVIGSLAASSAYGDSYVSSEDLLEDYSLLQRAMEELHPGLYRHVTEEELDIHWQALRKEFERDRTLRDAYLAISKFVATIRCGHTYANFVNQPAAVKEEVFNRRDKLPFFFKIFDRRMIVTMDASTSNTIERGTEILSIEGKPVSEILKVLTQFVKADGSNDGKRLYDLQVSGLGDFETFDIFFPLLFPPNNRTYRLDVRRHDSSQTHETIVDAVTAAERGIRIADRYGAIPRSNDDLWSFKHIDATTAYLKLETFVTWGMTTNWSKFLRDAFDELKTKETSNLIIDIRGNEGGDDAIYKYLLRNLAEHPVALPRMRELFRYDLVPHDLRPYLDTWDDAFYDRREEVESVDAGFYTWNDPLSSRHSIRPSREPYRGRVYLLVDASNSSGTFFFASICKEYKLATLVGQTTGGNLGGINGGQMFFLRLPNSGIEIDIPLVGYYSINKMPDAGLEPDIHVKREIENFVDEKDLELETVLNLISSED